MRALSLQPTLESIVERVPMPEAVAGPSTAFVDRPDAMVGQLSTLSATAVGVDVERADSARYFRRAALVQVGADDHCVLLDAVRLDDLGALGEHLAGRRVVLHALENDLEPLAALGVRLAHPADTAVAAAVLGLPTGLGPLLRESLDIELGDDKERFQRADWEQRPLTEDMIAYAAGDVVHLPALWDELDARLERAGRRGWYEQELAAAVERAFDHQRDWTRVKGIGRLGPEQRAVLRAVWEERERLARTHDIAPNRLLHDDVLRDLAQQPPRSEQDLVRRSPRRRRQLRQHAGDLLAAVERGRNAPPERRDPNGRRWSPIDRDLYDALRRRRAEIAEDLGIEAGVLCPSRPLWRAVVGAPGDGWELCSLAGLRPWQAELLATPLWETWEQVQAEGPEDNGAHHDPAGPPPTAEP